MNIVVVRRGEAVVRENQETVRKAAGDSRQEAREIRPDLRAVAFRKITAGLDRCFACIQRQRPVLSGEDMQLPPCAAFHLDQV